LLLPGAAPTPPTDYAALTPNPGWPICSVTVAGLLRETQVGALDKAQEGTLDSANQAVGES